MIYAYIIVLLLIAILLILNNKRIEGYGGPVKRIRRIPKNDCYGICKQYYNDCMRMYSHIDSNFCLTKLNNCIKSCYYSDFQRL